MAVENSDNGDAGDDGDGDAGDGGMDWWRRRADPYVFFSNVGAYSRGQAHVDGLQQRAGVRGRADATAPYVGRVCHTPCEMTPCPLYILGTEAHVFVAMHASIAFFRKTFDLFIFNHGSTTNTRNNKNYIQVRRPPSDD
ncbi:hypothetical protein VPH35_057388 [Triticum aestivum]